MVPVKYPRTYHLPWSNPSSDDKVMTSTIGLQEDIVITIKMDGENTSMYSNYIHARSLEGIELPGLLTSLYNTISRDIPEGFRICGENMYWQHSIKYENLASYFLVFSIWNNDTCLSWEDTIEYTNLLGLYSVPCMYKGPWNEKLVRDLAESNSLSNQEGYVVRVARDFKYEEFSSVVGKYVRKNHVTSDKHWRDYLVPNKLGARNETK